MEQRLVEAFDEVHMEKSCIEKVETAMKRKSETCNTVQPPWRKIAAAAACLVLVAVCVAVPVVEGSTYAMDDIMADMIKESGITDIEEEKKFSSNTTVVKDSDGHVASFSLGGAADWLEEHDGRLFFTANGERIDITDKISYEEPFTYIYTDEEQIIHYLAVGGIYDPDPAKTGHGWWEFFQNTPGTEPFDPLAEDGWICGSGHNTVDCDTETQYPWSVKALKEFTTPWNDLWLIGS